MSVAVTGRFLLRIQDTDLWMIQLAAKQALREERARKWLASLFMEIQTQQRAKSVNIFRWNVNNELLYKKFTFFIQGIADNLDLMPHHYPGWIIRVYYDLEPDDPELRLLCDLACSNPSLDICHVRNNPASGDISQIFAMNWRFFPTLDPNVDIFVSRDLDSRINSREKAAIEVRVTSLVVSDDSLILSSQDWYKTKKHFHFMRDNPAHGIEILGSGWGVRLGPQKSEVRRVFREAWRTASHDTMFWAARKAYGPDQVRSMNRKKALSMILSMFQGFLKRYIWPWAKWSAVSHDSYFCKQFPR